MMSCPPRRLTQQFIESLIWNGKRTFIRDSDLKGFMVVVNRTSKSYMVQRDVWKGPRGYKKLLGLRRPLIGRVGVMSLKIEIQPGKESGRHMHPFPTYVHVLEGTLTVEFEDGVRQSFKAGSSFLEAVNTWHNVKNLEEAPLRF